MKKSGMISLFATVFVVAIVVAGSAFIKKGNVKPQITYDYFQYTASSYGETDYENSGNWSSLGTSNPGSNPCTNGSTHTCVLKIDDSRLSTDPSLTMPQKIALFLQNQSDPNGATNFVTNASNYTYRKP
ncbi:MAG: hypothetical protein HY252_02190 [Sphingobacteriales bacterium]|nr:hypothetical protein [Sphingobacteriales bacterium]